MKEMLQKVIDRAVEEKLLAGVSVLVTKDGKEVCYLQSGLASVEENKPITRDTIYRLYSQSKPVTAAAAMILMERGILDLGQPVGDYLPAYQHLTYMENGVEKPVRRTMFVADLLRMTGGLSYPSDLDAAGLGAKAVFDEAIDRLYTENPMGTVALAEKLAGYPLSFEPGSAMQYSSCADVLAAVIEVASGMRFGEFLEKNIFAPLGMNDTAFYVPEEKQNRLARVYETVKENGETTLKRYTGNNLAIQNEMKLPPAYEAGGAGLVSTLDDYNKFAQMLLNGGSYNGVQILKPETVKYMTTGELTEAQQASFERDWFGLAGYTYSNFLRVCNKPGRAQSLTRLGEYGWDGWLGTYLANFPEENMTLLVGMQKVNGGITEMTRRVRNVLLSNI